MPYDLSEDRDKIRTRLEKTYKNVSDTMVRQFIHVINSILERGGSKEQAFAGAYAAINKRGVQKKEGRIASVLARWRERLAGDEATQDDEPEPVPDREPDAIVVAGIIGGMPTVWSNGELRIEDAGIGMDVHFKSGCRYMEVSLSIADLPAVVKWMKNRAKDLGGVKPKEHKFADLIDNRLLFGPIMCEVLRLGGVACSVRKSKEYILVINSRVNVLRIADMFFGPKASKALTVYFDIKSVPKRKRPSRRKVKEKKTDRTTIKPAKVAKKASAVDASVSFDEQGPLARVLNAAGRLPAEQSTDGNSVWVEYGLCPNLKAAPYVDAQKTKAYCLRGGTVCEGLAIALMEQNSVVCHFATPIRLREALGPIPARRGRKGLLLSSGVRISQRMLSLMKEAQRLSKLEDADAVISDIGAFYVFENIGSAIRSVEEELLRMFRSAQRRWKEPGSPGAESVEVYESAHWALKGTKDNIERFLTGYTGQDMRRFLSELADVDQAEAKRVIGDYYKDDETAQKILDITLRLIAAASQFNTELENLKERFVLTIAPGSRTVVKTEKREQLYHASINARTLYRKGFSATIPDEAGLGGSRSTTSMDVPGTSFTYDLYVAKEIARVFKEMWLVANGKTTAESILEATAKKRITAKVIDNARRYKDLMHGLPRTLAFTVEKEEVIVTDYVRKDGDYSRQRAPLRALFKGVYQTMALYRAYLTVMGQSNRRYDPFVMGRNADHIRNFKRIKYRDIGVVVATIDMTNEHVTQLPGEREVRVPPVAILSVDRLIQ